MPLYWTWVQVFFFFPPAFKTEDGRHKNNAILLGCSGPKPEFRGPATSHGSHSTYSLGFLLPVILKWQLLLQCSCTNGNVAVLHVITTLLLKGLFDCSKSHKEMPFARWCFSILSSCSCLPLFSLFNKVSNRAFKKMSCLFVKVVYDLSTHSYKMVYRFKFFKNSKWNKLLSFS